MIIKEPNYRVKRGTKASDLPSQRATSPPPLDSLDGPFRLAEYLSYKVWRDPHDVRGLVELPIGDEGEAKQDKNVWIYEHLRRLPIDLTPLLSALLPICTKESCPQMKADEWMYLCVAHGGSGTEECCAIDYILHTVDSTATLLNSSKSFPSRMSIPNTSLSHFPSLFRRLSRIFSHAYYHHREAFSLAEAETSLYARFVALCETYDLVGSNLLVIPKSAFSNLGESSQSAEEDDEPSSEESEDADDDDNDEAAGEGEGGEGGAGRGREGEGKEKERRTQSLDRNSSPADDRAGGLRKEPLLPKTPASASGETSAAALQTAKHDSGLDRSRTVKTLGRGKQNRGTMLWSSDTPPVQPSSDETDTSSGMARSESLDTVVHISPEPTEALLPPIEGISEASKISEEHAVSSEAPTEGPTGITGGQSNLGDPQTSSPETASIDEQISLEPTSAADSSKQEGNGDLVDVKLDDDSQQNISPVSESSSTQAPSSPETSTTSADSAKTSPEALSSPSAPTTQNAAATPDAPPPRSPNPDSSPVRSRSAHGVGRTSKPSTPAKSFVANSKSPAAPLLSTGGSGDSPAKSGDTAPEKTEKVEEKSPLSSSSASVPSGDAEA